MIPRNIIDQVLEAARIEEVVGEFVQLKRSGSSYKGLSPFTSERTPSFYVVPSKGIFKDFSSGKGGNVVTFLMEQEHLSFQEAIRYLARKYNIEVPEERAPTAEEIAEQNARESLALVNQLAADYFEQVLWEVPEGQDVALSYLRERGFNDPIIKRFKLGYCPESGQGLVQHARELGHQPKYLLQAGLIKEKEGRYYDFFRGRVIFPLRNLTGRVIAFGGRTLKKEKNIAKYFNSPESELYVKSNTLYGLFEGKAAISKHNLCYLVEGYTDVIALHQTGVENVVASSGTSLTSGQIKLIKRYTPNVTVLYDGDAAGIRATFRGIDMLLEEGMNVRCVTFPDGHDPDSYSRVVTQDAFLEHLHTTAQDFISFKAHLLLAEAGDDPLKRAELIHGLISSIALVPDRIARGEHVKRTATLLGTAEEALTLELNRLLRKKLQKEARDKEQQQAAGGYPDAPDSDDAPFAPLPEERKSQLTEVDKADTRGLERELLRLLVAYGHHEVTVRVENPETGKDEEEKVSLCTYILHSLSVDELTVQSPELGDIVTYAQRCEDEERMPDFINDLSLNDQEKSRLISDLVATRYELSQNWMDMHKVMVTEENNVLVKAVDDCTMRWKFRRIIGRLTEVDGLLKEEKDAGKIEELLKEKMHLNSVKTRLNSFFGTVIV